MVVVAMHQDHICFHGGASVTYFDGREGLTIDYSYSDPPHHGDYQEDDFIPEEAWPGQLFQVLDDREGAWCTVILPLQVCQGTVTLLGCIFFRSESQMPVIPLDGEV